MGFVEIKIVEKYMNLFNNQKKNHHSLKKIYLQVIIFISILSYIFRKKTKNSKVNSKKLDRFLNNISNFFQTILHSDENEMEEEEDNEQDNIIEDIKSLLKNNKELFSKISSVWKSIEILKNNLEVTKQDYNNIYKIRLKGCEIRKKLKNRNKSPRKMKKTISKLNQEDKSISFTPKKTLSEFSQTKKIILRLIPSSKTSHQIMMKLNNFPRLELKYDF